MEEKAEKLKEMFGSIPLKEMQAMQQSFQKVAEIMQLLSEVLPPIEIKPVTRTFKQGDKTFSKDYIAIYIERPAKKEAKP